MMFPHGVLQYQRIFDTNMFGDGSDWRIGVYLRVDYEASYIDYELSVWHLARSIF